MSFKVELTYFKESGKYYTSGYYTTEKKEMFEIFEEVRALQKVQILPGLVEKHGPYYVSIDVPDHLFNYPHMCVPDEWNYNDHVGGALWDTLRATR